MKLPSLPLALSIAALLLTSAGAQIPAYSLQRLGLTGGMFTDPAGYEFSTVVALEGGIVAGTSAMKITSTSGGGIIIGGGGPLTIVTQGYGQWLGNLATGVTTRVGLYDAEFTRSDNGLQNGTLLGFSGGVAAGQAIRYSGNSGNGEASWIANAATGQSYRIGFYDAAYTFDGDYQDTHVQYVQGGYAAGYSSAAVGGPYGPAAWVANSAGVTTRVGLHGAGFTNEFNQQTASVLGLNNGTVIGIASAYSSDGAVDLGQAAWMTNAATGSTTRLGFTGAAYTRPDGTQLSRAQYVKDGYVAGFSATSVYGSEQWVAPVATGTAVRVGLTSSTFTSSTGEQYAYSDLLSDGYIAGQSYLYNGGASYAGHAAWVSSAANDTTRRIGFFNTAPYERNDGHQYSLTTHLTGNYVAGYSRQYSGSAQIGAATWVAPVVAGDAVRVGLYDADFTNNNGGQSSTVSQLKGEYVAGTSTRYLGGSTALGPRAWIADAATGTTTALGMTDAAHTSSTGIQWSNILHLTATGYLAGSSNVYSGTSYHGDTAWIWDANTSTFDPIDFSISPTTGGAVSYISQLFDSGLAIGQYQVFDGAGTALEVRPFGWTPTDGQFDLTNAVAGGISAAGWSSLITAGYADPLTGAVIGYGRVPLSSASQAVYAATPTPEPGSATLLALGALGLGLRRRRSAR